MHLHHNMKGRRRVRPLSIRPKCICSGCTYILVIVVVVVLRLRVVVERVREDSRQYGMQYLSQTGRGYKLNPPQLAASYF